jgi:hypothetical protein
MNRARPLTIRSGTRRATAVAVLAATIAAAVWSARSAEAIIIVNSTTGMFTLTSRDAVRIFGANTAEEAGIIIVNSIFDSDGNLLHQSGPQRVPLGRTGFFDYSPDLPDGGRTAVRVVLTVQGARGGKPAGFIPSIEVFDRETGRTCWFVDYIIDDGDAPVR